MILIKKAHAVSYALLRVAETFKRTDLKGKLESQAVVILDTVLSQNYDLAQKAIGLTQNFVLLAEGVNEISYQNSQILLREVESLKNAIIEETQKEVTPRFNLEEIFSESFILGSGLKPATTPVAPASLSANKPLVFTPTSGNHLSAPITREKVTASVTTGSSEQVARHPAIMSFVKQKGRCQIKDILAVFPNFSERTIRYDLQKLCDQGMLERIGHSGPSTYYRLPNKSATKPLLAGK